MSNCHQCANRMSVLSLAIQIHGNEKLLEYMRKLEDCLTESRNNSSVLRDNIKRLRTKQINSEPIRRALDNFGPTVAGVDELRMFYALEQHLITQMANQETCEEKLEYARALAMINAAQIQCLEEVIGVDLDGDGHIGAK